MLEEKSARKITFSNLLDEEFEYLRSTPVIIHSNLSKDNLEEMLRGILKNIDYLHWLLKTIRSMGAKPSIELIGCDSMGEKRQFDILATFQRKGYARISFEGGFSRENMDRLNIWRFVKGKEEHVKHFSQFYVGELEMHAKWYLGIPKG